MQISSSCNDVSEEEVVPRTINMKLNQFVVFNPCQHASSNLWLAPGLSILNYYSKPSSQLRTRSLINVYCLFYLCKMMLPVKNSYEVGSSILSSLYIYKTHILYIGKEKVILNFCRNYRKCTSATVLKYPIILFKLKQQLHQNLWRLHSI